MGTFAASRVIKSMYQAKTLGEARAKLGKALNLEGPAPADVTARALSDRKFATYLAGLRHFPKWRNRLLHDPMNARFAPPSSATDPADARSVHSTAQLVKKSATALLRWGASGFKTVEPWVLKTRREACLSCEHLTDAPNTAAYALTKRLAGTDRRICSACGCLMTKKTLMPSERCPVASDVDPRRSRWGDFFNDGEQI